MLYANSFNHSLDRSIKYFRKSVFVVASLERVRLISYHVLAFSVSGIWEKGEKTRNSQRNSTWQLSEFENIAFRKTKLVFFTPLHLCATLDDELFGWRAQQNTVKAISNRKADVEGHIADSFACAFLKIIFQSRFRRLHESQDGNVRKLMETVLDGCGEKELVGITVTSDRGYGKEAFIPLPAGFGLGSVIILQENPLKVQPFFALRYLNVSRVDPVTTEAEKKDGPNSTGSSSQHEDGNLREKVVVLWL